MLTLLFCLSISDAPLQWFFDGLYKVGSLAVPDNVLILGCNLSASYKTYVRSKNSKKTQHGVTKSMHQLSQQTMLGIVIGKMLVMPVIGIGTTYLLGQCVLTIPDEIAGAAGTTACRQVAHATHR